MATNDLQRFSENSLINTTLGIIGTLPTDTSKLSEYITDIKDNNSSLVIIGSATKTIGERSFPDLAEWKDITVSGIDGGVTNVDIGFIKINNGRP